MEQGNILGEEFKQYVFNQIDVRQSIHGAGGQSSLLNRDPKYLNYLNNRNAWVKMASGVSLIDPNLPSSTEPVAAPSKAQVITQTTNKLTTGLDRLKNISKDLLASNGDLSLTKYNTTGLAKNFILFNTLSNLNFEKGNQKFSNYTFRSGIQKSQESWLDVDSSYGFGGTAMGFQPTPGIIDVSIDCVNRGSIRKATVTLKAYNRYQFSIIEMLYLRLGYTMMLEWGWDKYAIEEGGNYIIKDTETTIIEDLWFKDISPTQTQIISTIETYREKYNGNYDGFFGKVNNFTWNFNSDGSYDITINLITVGDVVESLKVNVDAPIQSSQNITSQQKKIEDVGITEGSIFNAAGGDVLSQYLLSIILNRTNSDVKVLKFSERIRNIKGQENIQELKTPPELDYFITLGDFLEKIEELVIPTQKPSENVKEKVISIETDRNTNYISCFYNQIPFDPKVCIFTTLWGESFIKGYPSLNSNIKGFPLQRLDKLTHKFMVSKEGFVAGKLMNIYMNIDFLLKKINSNLDEKGDLSLYKLVESICSGLNDALGNVNNLEPVIKDDKTLVIIDQNPISNINKFIGQPKDTKSSTTEIKPLLEVYGYNKGKSNFLKDIKFQTKIDNSLASTISISSTAGGSSTKNYDATAFSKWSVGLKDRFSPPQEEPDTKNLTATGVNLTEYLKTAEKWVRSGENIKLTNNQQLTGHFIIKGNSEYIEDYFWSTNPDLKYSFQRFPKPEEAIRSWLKKVEKNKRLKDKTTKSQAELEALVNGTYALVLHDIFGRKIGITYEGLPFNLDNKPTIYQSLFTDEALVKKLKSSFKAYLNVLSNTQFNKNQQASGNIGFIPVSFDITLEGLSGVKIYNKLNIDTRFLPLNYGDALDFLITKVNHRISGNNWDTILGTISTSNIKDAQGEPISNILQTAKYDQIAIKNQIAINSIPTKVEDYQPNNQGLNPVKNLIASGESKGKYDIANNGDKKYKISTQKIVNQKISYLLDITSKRSKGSPNKTFAMGKYQIIPSTLEALVSYSKDKAGENYVGRDWTYDNFNQEKLGNLLLLTKRPGAGAYLSGKNQGTKEDLERALQQIGQEWASMPCIINKSRATVGDVENGTGKGAYYGGTGVNPAVSHVTLRQMVNALIQSRIQYSNKQPSYKPNYYS
jgi:hypothetical protein